MSESLSSTRLLQMAVLAVVAALVGMAVPSLAAPKSHVQLEYVPKMDATPCAIHVVPDTQIIWKDKSKYEDLPHTVRWRMIKSQRKKFYWKITYKSGDNVLSAPDITCNGTKSDSSDVGNPSGTGLEWVYKVSVHKCPYNSAEAALCEKDPKIGIQD